MKWQWLRYSLRVWLTAAVIGAMIVVASEPHAYDIGHKENLRTFLQACFYFTLFGLYYSFPSFLLCLILVFILRSRSIPAVTKKIMLCCSAVIFIYFNMKYTIGYGALDYLIYTLAACSAILFFRFKTAESKKQFQF